MTDEENNGVVETPPNPDEVDLEELIGGVLEARGFTVDRAAKLDLLDSLGSLGDSFGLKLEEVLGKLQPGTSTAASSGSSEGFDSEGFLGKVGELIDSKLAAFTPGGTPAKEKKKPLLQRALGVK